MALRDYCCGKCGHTQTIKQGLTENLLTTCPSCGKDAFRVNFFDINNFPHALVVPGDDECTVGTLAERNSRRMSREARDKADKEAKTKREKASNIHYGGKAVDRSKPKEKPWFLKNTTQKDVQKIAQMTPNQQERYIATGQK